MVSYTALVQIFEQGELIGFIDVLLITLLIASTAFILYLFHQLQLIVVLHEEGICFKYFLLQKNYRLITFEEILNYEIRSFEESEYGDSDSNWGVKTHKNNVAYIAKSKRGIELHLKDGRKVFISLEDPEAFVRQMRQQLMVHWAFHLIKQT